MAAVGIAQSFRPLKRRRLSAHPPDIALNILAPGNPLNAATKPSFQVEIQPAPRGHACNTCYRMLNGPLNTFVFCSRCSSTVCTVCSRTCTSCAPSQPPTPHLTWSPTPTPSPTLLSPRPVVFLSGHGATPHLSGRTGTAGDAVTTHAGGMNVRSNTDAGARDSSVLTDSVAGHRRKVRDGDGGEVNASRNEGRGILKDHNGAMRGAAASAFGREDYDEGWGPGCGRVVCRNCCIENTQNASTTCHDCYGY